MIGWLICCIWGHQPRTLAVKMGTSPAQLNDVVMNFCGRCNADLPPEEPHGYPELRAQPAIPPPITDD